MVVYDRSIIKPDKTQQNITTKAVHDMFCTNTDNKQQNITTMYIKDTSVSKLWQHTAKHDNYGCKDNPKQNMSTLAVCDTSYTFSMKPDNRQQNITTTAVKTKHDNHVHKEYIHHKTLTTRSKTWQLRL